MANKLLNFRCPSELLGAIDKIGAVYYPADNDNGYDRSKTLIDILVAGVESLTNGEVVLPLLGTVKQDVRPSPLPDIKAMVEALVEEKFAQQTAQNPVQIPVQIPPNLPTQTQFHELKERVNDFRLSLLREIQNRDKGISLLAEQVAELTARLDNMPAPVVDKETLETAKGTVLKNWRLARSPEKRSRIELALNKFVNEISPQEQTPTPQPQPDPQINSEVGDKKVTWKVGDKCSVKMPSGVIIAGAEIVSIQKAKGTCKVFVPETNSHFLSDLNDLIVPPADEEINVNKKIPLSVGDWEQVCNDNVNDLKAQWYDT